MEPTPYPDINTMLDELLSAIQQILGNKLVGLYLYGSLVTGDFDPGSSDIDLLAATTLAIDEPDFAALNRMHDDFAARNTEWAGRIEVHYYPVAGLRTFKTRSHPMAAISPGEPFNMKQAGKEWTVNWYVVQEKGITLFGPPPRTLIDPVSHEEFVASVRAYARVWREHVDDARHSRPDQAYAILTMCRALYSTRHGEQVSKQRAALWAQRAFPEWAPLIANALQWRAAWRDEHVDPEGTFPETARFVRFAIDQVTKTDAR